MRACGGRSIYGRGHAQTFCPQWGSRAAENRCRTHGRRARVTHG
ncbi:unnamed protein product [Pelagomonas calceolata]|uniref:Uncharacterized protein n=1 Tax=Pelagomonas calceolata TaxID=35677 RepID=A0A8J2S702_9STRA|nr:unnamed protein product [Pelagomonas calceolata]